MSILQPAKPVVPRHQLSVELFDSDDLAALVASTVRADLVRRLRLEA
jgi:hypothetical protein